MTSSRKWPNVPLKAHCKMHTFLLLRHRLTYLSSAMLVQIKRPWLHSELFSDHAIDTMQQTKLSPGAVDLKNWIEKGNRTGLDPYSEFPAYPTAFIVAADTVLEVKKPFTDI